MDNETMLHAGCVGTQEQVAGCGQALGKRVTTAPASAVDEGDARGAPTEASEQRTEQPNPPQTLREFERALRSLGYTRVQAEHIGRRGFAGIHAPNATEQAEPDQLHQALQKLVQAMKA